MRRTIWLFSILLMFSLALYAQDARQRAYDIGFQAGYNQGYNDSQAGDVADVANSSAYQDASSGWSGQIGRDEYRQNYRSGFQSGYNTGYQDASNGVPANPVSNPSAGSDQSGQAFRNGYQAGYNSGQHDAGASYAMEGSPAYRDATIGFDAARFGSIEVYRDSFRKGFAAGYNDAYYGRAFDPRYNVPRLDQQGRPITGAYGPGYGTGYGTPSSTDVASDNGYREGYRLGRADAGGTFRPKQASVYRDAMIGYGPNLGSRTSYRDRFRDGFLAGYDDGFNGRLARGEAYGPRGVGPYSSYPGGVLATGNILVPAGTFLHLRLNDALSTKTSQPGDHFTALVSDPVYLPGTNEIAIPQGSIVHGTVTSVQRGGTLTGNAEMRLAYDSISMPQAGDYSLYAQTVGAETSGNVNPSEGQIERGGSTTKTIGEVAAGTVLGAIIGGIAGGGRGAGIGAAAGTAAGLGVVFATRGRDVNLDSGTPMEIRLDAPLELRR